ncbi:hypothetical protein ACFPME_06685 [Rhodanobacter umsongensis]|uniref:Lipoprotein n=1 Tax=Rhodanobacter umsongensis TaxID=633153 RepID=A0ABW0JLD6_9GAMM
MRRFVSTAPVTLSVVMGTFALGGCTVPVHDRGCAAGHHDDSVSHDDHDRDRDSGH